jgi:hypothetical protein
MTRVRTIAVLLGLGAAVLLGASTALPASPRQIPQPRSGDGLPFTGVDLLLIVAGVLVLLAVGAVARRIGPART